MATFQAPGVTTYGYQPPGTGHGNANTPQHLHATAAVSAAMTTNDTIEFGYIPNNAVVVGVILKAQSQLDSATSLTFDMGVTGSATLWKSAISTVGRAVGVSSDSTIATGGGLYKNTSGAKQKVIVTCHAAAGTPVAGKLEASVSYFVEDTVASQA